MYKNRILIWFDLVWFRGWGWDHGDGGQEQKG